MSSGVMYTDLHSKTRASAPSRVTPSSHRDPDHPCVVRARTGVLIIRAWLEGSSPRPLRVEMRRTDDISSGIETAGTFTEIAEVLASVEQWLLEMRAAPPAGGGEPLRVVRDPIHGT